MGKPVVGAQMYTVREFTKTLDGIKRSLDRVAEIGYKAVQLSGFGPADPRDVAKAVESAGLIVASTHTGWDRFLDDLDAVIEEHQLWGCDHPAIGGLPKEYYSLEGLERFKEELVPIAERLAEVGMDFSYHNHNHEFASYDGKLWIERLYDDIAPEYLKAELDVYWVQAGGGDPAHYVARYAGREPLLHLKDMAITPERELRFAEFGEGNLNWDAILPAAKRAGVRWYLVEQDLCYDRDPFDSLAISYQNLKKWGLE
jgi:sugar phosphate isomerase/epimerase